MALGGDYRLEIMFVCPLSEREREQKWKFVGSKEESAGWCRWLIYNGYLLTIYVYLLYKR